MIIKNITRNTIITEDLKIASTFFDRMFGLLLKRNLKSLLFKTRFGIHTFFLKQSIEMLVLNDNSKVINSETIKPNKLFFYNPIYDTVIELPEGAIKKSKTEIGDIIELF